MLVRETILLAGEPRDVAAKLGSKGIAPLEVAIALLGGVVETANKLDIPRTSFQRMLVLGPRKWKGGYLEKISDITSIPMKILLLSAEEMAERSERYLREGFPGE